MVKTLFLPLLCFLWLTSFSLAATALPPSDSPGTSAVAQDATGTVWALPAFGNGNDDGTLRRRQVGTWAIETVPGAAGFRPRVLTRGADGAVYAFWQTFSQGPGPTPRCLITVHRGAASRILARFSEAVVQDRGFADFPTLAADATGDVWLSGDRPMLWHISPDGSVTPFPLTADQCFDGKLPGQSIPHAFSSLRDGKGRRWFWQSGLPFNWQPNGLRGVLIWDGTRMAYHPTISGVPDRAYSVLMMLDKNHVWLATKGDDPGQHFLLHGGLYRVDTRTLTAVPETVPPGAFQSIVQVFQAGGDWYVVDQRPYGQMASLWREEAGHWRKILDTIEEMGGYYRPDLQYSWLAEPSGVWLGAGGGAWWLPRGGKPPLWVNWRRGLAALPINGLFPLTNGSILAVGPQSDAQMSATPQPIQPLPPGIVTGGMGAPLNLGPILADPRHHLWGMTLSSSGSWALYEWDGKRWRMHLVPKSVEGFGGLYACDTLGRIWLTTSVWHPPAQPQPVEGRAVYDPGRDTWTAYKTVADALQAAAALPGMAFLPYHNLYQPPLFSGDDRVITTDGTKIDLYDGQTWRHWVVSDIMPHYPYGNMASPPHFNALGHLELALYDSGQNQQLWEWTPAAGWQRGGEQSTVAYSNPIPPNGPNGLWGAAFVDRDGAKWFIWQDAVYTAYAGLWAKQTELSAPGSPFHHGFGIEDVLRDPFGRFFFVTRPAGYYDLVVWSPPPVPRPTLSIVPTSDDSVAAHFQSKLRGPHWFQWRLNRGAWSSPQTADTLTLTALPHGAYRVEAQALDQRLQLSPTVAAVFSIRVASGTQIARWVQALLSDTDDQREAAVAGLLKQPDAALPALRAARPGASESGRWWLDAAIQEIMEQNQAAGNAGP